VSDESVDSEAYHACLKNAVFRSSFNLEMPYKTRAGIVSFKHQRSASILCQSLISSKMFSCIAQPAPAPNDIKYDNINKSPLLANIQRLLCSFLFVLFTLMFFSAVGVIASFCNLNYIESKFTRLADLLREHENWRATLNGVLSPLAYNILMTIGPIFIRLIITLESNYSGTADQLSLMNRYSVFLFLNGFLSFVTTYSVHQLSGFDELKKVLEGLQSGLLKTSVFFMNALIQKALVGQVLILLQVGPLISKSIAYVFGSKTLRSRKQLAMSIPLDFGTMYPNMLLIFAICLVYSIITPIILVVGFVFYVSCFAVFKNEFIYCVKNDTETGGVHFNFAATYIIYILIFFQASTAVQYLTTRNTYLSLCLFVLAVLTFFLKSAFLKSFQRACTFYPLSLQEEHYIDAFTRTLLLSRVRFIKKWTQHTGDEMVELRMLGYVDAECAMAYERPTDKEGVYLDTEVFLELEKIYG
ncbi:putative transporter, partial [Trachipleistophora hominis]